MVDLRSLLGQETIEHGLTVKYDRNNRFRLIRTIDSFGFHIYCLENLSKKENIFVQGFVFDRFRAALVSFSSHIPSSSSSSSMRRTMEDGGNAESSSKDFVMSIEYKGKCLFNIRCDTRSNDKIIIQELFPKKGSTGFISFDMGAVDAVSGLLSQQKVFHPNEVLNRIISYHKLFQFTFAEGSESITSDLSLKKDVLSNTEVYIPPLDEASKEYEDKSFVFDKLSSEESQGMSRKSNLLVDEEGQLFKSRLAERARDQPYRIDYGLLFKESVHDSKQIDDTLVRSKKSTSSNASGARKNYFHIPLMTSDVKHFTQIPFKCEFSTDQIKDLRNNFLGERENEFFIGFEIIDAVHRGSSRGLRTFKFPLYYMRVKVRESGRDLYVEPLEGGRIFLNHLALAHLVRSFDENKPGRDSLDEFLNTLLAQSIDVEKRLSRIYLARHLPFDEAIFQRTREVLLGFPGENGKGGILSSLKVLGIECDLDSVYLYKTPKITSPTSAALESDMDSILNVAVNHPDRFQRSLLGGFLAPGSADKDGAVETFAEVPWIPGALPKSTRRLLDQLEESDLVLLEGPPGTGKTFAIMNLFIHCLCTGKRLLVVSDQIGAIHALTEKMEEYLVGKDKTSNEAKGVLALWGSAIKVVDQIPSPDTTLAKWAIDLRKMLNVDVAQEGFWPETDDRLDEQLALVDQRILRIKMEIQSVMDGHLGADAAIEDLVTPKKMHATTEEDIERLCAFIKFINKSTRKDTVYGVNARPVRDLITQYIVDREEIRDTRFKAFYDSIATPDVVRPTDLKKLDIAFQVLCEIEATAPRRLATFMAIISPLGSSPLSDILRSEWDAAFPLDTGKVSLAWRVSLSLVHYPLGKSITTLKNLVLNHLLILRQIRSSDPGVIFHLQEVHCALAPGCQDRPPLSLEICRFASRNKSEAGQSGLASSRFLGGGARQASKSKGRPLGDHVDIGIDDIDGRIINNAIDSDLSLQSRDSGKTRSRSKLQKRGLSVQESLEMLTTLQESRDSIVRLQVLGQLEQIARGAFQYDDKSSGGTSLATSISTLLESLKNQKNIETGVTFHSDLKKKMVEAFPIWICRKQAVSFLFPCLEESFDLVIVDEATQCRVDDALPILYRAKKVMVVGDEKQTVLAKNSVVDDYLFNEFSLEEHLRQTQARGLKGGGSHLFGLVKGIKQGHVMLDEHYRCPPEIIEFSNRYVYNNQLRKMQWTPVDAPSTVCVNYSEKQSKLGGRRELGKFKGLETDMIDRFLQYVHRTILEIEQETNCKINVETDVALCYFLLKNEPYMKHVKHDFLTQLNRGSEILDGAGAALQGKERDYIFYFWDIRRSNMMAFRQGDDETKRKGELNVLMSRPKKRAFHFIHKDFCDLDHASSNITDFLWKAYASQSEIEEKLEFEKRKQRPGPGFRPWRRSSGQLMASVVDNILSYNGKISDDLVMPNKIDKQYSVVVGDPKYCVDLMVISEESRRGLSKSVAVVDLSGFDSKEGSADDIIDYYFQLQRAKPSILPVFMFMHEIADSKSPAYGRLLDMISQLGIKSEKSMLSSKSSDLLGA